jgi:hypothetical protein
MVRFLEGLQYRSVIVSMLTIFLLIGFFSMGLRFASAGPSDQTQYNVGYNDGLKNAKCDFKHCHGHGYDMTVPSAHTTAYDNGYSKGYHDGWNNDTGDKTQQSHGMGGINTTVPENSTILKSQEIPNNHGCDPTHQFCTMTPK